MNGWFDIKELAGRFAAGALVTISLFLIAVEVMFGTAVFMALAEYGLADGWKVALMAFVLMAGTGGGFVRSAHGRGLDCVRGGFYGL